jgi:hypothetical protein
MIESSPRRGINRSLGAGTRKRFPMKVGATYHFVTDGVLRHGKALGWGRAGATLITPDGEYAVTWDDLREGIHPEVAKSLAQEDRPIRPTLFTAEDIRPGAVVVFTEINADGCPDQEYRQRRHE